MVCGFGELDSYGKRMRQLLNLHMACIFSGKSKDMKDNLIPDFSLIGSVKANQNTANILRHIRHRLRSKVVCSGMFFV